MDKVVVTVIHLLLVLSGAMLIQLPDTDHRVVGGFALAIGFVNGASLLWLAQLAHHEETNASQPTAIARDLAHLREQAERLQRHSHLANSPAADNILRACHELERASMKLPHHCFHVAPSTRAPSP